MDVVCGGLLGRSVLRTAIPNTTPATEDSFYTGGELHRIEADLQEIRWISEQNPDRRWAICLAGWLHEGKESMPDFEERYAKWKAAWDAGQEREKTEAEHAKGVR
jgi:hypothetical protein